MSFLVWFVSLRRRNDKLVTLGSVANIEKTAFYNCFFFFGKENLGLRKKTKRIICKKKIKTQHWISGKVVNQKKNG